MATARASSLLVSTARRKVPWPSVWSSVRCASTAMSSLQKAFANRTFKTHDELYKFSINNPDEFWGGVARHQLNWYRDFDSVVQADMAKAEFKWFQGGKLNSSVNCVDRHAAADPDRVALIWEKDEPGQQEYITYSQLSESVNRLANVLLRHGVKRGSVVTIYMPVSPMAVAAMLACGRIGALHNVVFAGFSAEALAGRMIDCGSVALITADEGVRGGKRLRLKDTADAAVAKCGAAVKTVLVMKRTGASDVQMGPNEFYLEDEMAREAAECRPEMMNSEDTLFILYTSGSTGKPKGLAHSTAGYLTYASLTQKVVFDCRPGDVFGCVADIGWITGHSYVVYGPLVNGVTSVLFESTPTYPDPGRYWETVQRLGIHQFYGAPTAIRLLLRYGDEHVKKYDRSSLRTLASVGEPINHEAWQWFNDVVGDGRCDLVDTWWQTETGGVAIAPRPADEGSEIVSGKPMRPMLGMEPVLIDDKNQVVEGNDASGALCIKAPWPGVARTVYGDHKRYVETYFSPYPGYYFSGDGGHRDESGYWQITGRMDDVINVSGHRMGTAEVEDVMDEHPLVAETAVVGYPHQVKGEGVYAYIILKENAISGSGAEAAEQEEKLKAELKASVKKNITSFAVPDYLQICSGLPKTRSGKIMRRVLRKVAADQMDDLGDISTLADPSVVEEIVKNHKEMKK